MNNESLSRARRKLKPSETIVTSVMGVKTVNGEVLKDRSHGFVVDTSIDNRPCHVIDGIFVGSLDAAMNTEALKHHNIQVIINLSGENYTHEGIKVEVHCFELLDLDTAGDALKRVAEQSLTIIQDCVQHHRNILVHCQMGVSRSVSVIMWYLIVMRGMSYDAALQQVKSNRPQAMPNLGFRHELRKLTK